MCHIKPTAEKWIIVTETNDYESRKVISSSKLLSLGIDEL